MDNTTRIIARFADALSMTAAQIRSFTRSMEVIGLTPKQVNRLRIKRIIGL